MLVDLPHGCLWGWRNFNPSVLPWLHHWLQLSKQVSFSAHAAMTSFSPGHVTSMRSSVSHDPIHADL